MTEKIWQTIKVQHCSRAGTEVSLEAQVIYPADQMPDQGPRILAHRCSHGIDCGLLEEHSCVWSGNNPTYDPFAEGPHKTA